jgi:hypothetical protein
VEPIERVLVAAEKVGVKVVAPRPGASVEINPHAPAVERWWGDDVPWIGVDKRPAWSTSVEELLQASPLYVPPDEK